MIIKSTICILLSILAGYLNYYGGQEGYTKKIKFLGIPLLCFAPMMLIWGIHGFWQIIALILSTGALIPCINTYWKGKEIDCKWYHWAITGFMYGFSSIFLTIATGHWLWFGIRCLILAIWVCYWSETQSKVFNEAFGRGVAIIATIWLI